MRKLVYFTMVSLDGYIETVDHSLEWVIVDEELHRFINVIQERDTGMDVNGRRMYELMQAFWPTADNRSNPDYIVEYARIWKQIPKLVFSSTLDKVEGNARLVRGDAVAEVQKLKAEDGKNLEVGGAELAGALMKAGLVDEYRIFVQPVILGAGTRMIPMLDQPVNLRLVETRTFGSGVVYLRYQRRYQRSE